VQVGGEVAVAEEAEEVEEAEEENSSDKI